MIRKSFLLGAAAAALSVAISTASLADDTEIKSKAEDCTKAQVAKWVADADVVAALNAANSSNAVYDQGKIDELDKQWRAEVREQASATQEISTNAQRAAERTGNVNQSIRVVTETVDETSRAAGVLLDQSNNLATKATELQQQADAFVRQVEAG